MFAVAPVGIACALVGIAYMLLFSRLLLKDRKPAISLDSDPREYTVEMMVEPGGALCGRTIEEAGLRNLPGAYLMEIERDGDAIVAVGPEQRLKADDRLIFVGIVDSIVELQRIRGLRPATDQVFKLDGHRDARCLVEAVVSGSCPLVGMTIRDGRFRNVYNAAGIAVARNGARITRKIGDIVLETGDVLLLETHNSFAETHRNARDFLLVTQLDNSSPVRHERAGVAVAILLGMVVLAATGVMSMLNAALVAACLMIATRCVTGPVARRSIDWQVLTVIGAALGIGKALETSGGAAFIVTHFLGLAGHDPVLALVVMAFAVEPIRRLGSEFMPPLNEGSLLYMPTTLPGLSIAEAERLLQVQDRLIMQFPEVERVFGKAGRAETATDPAPLSMFETVILLKPENEWRSKQVWYSDWAPAWLKPLLRRVTPDRISQDELVAGMNARLQIPGVSNAWTMPIKARIDMLTTGIRTPVGVKISGASYRELDRLGAAIERALLNVPGTRSVFAERSGGGYFLDFVWKRDELARYGLTIAEAQMAVANAIGGENLTTTVEGRERYPVNVRYARDFRSSRAALENVLVPAMGGMAQIPLRQLADIRAEAGPAMYRNEDGLLTAYVYVDIGTSDTGGYLERARRAVREHVQVPPGYALAWSGQYEAMDRAAARLRVVVPVTLALILLLLYLNTRSGMKTAIVLLAVPFSAIGAVWLLWLLDYNLSIAVWVGILALLGIDAETGVFMLLYLDLAYKKAREEGRLRNLAELREAIVEGAVRRIRPKFMTVATTFIALTPILWAQGTGADVMKRIAAPMVGGVFTSFLLELIVYPAIYEVWKWNSEVKRNASV